MATMREALGADAAHVTFVDVSSAYTRPARTLAAYHRVYARQLQRTPTLRAVADVQFGPDPREWDLWTGYEAVFNRSFGHLPPGCCAPTTPTALRIPSSKACGRPIRKSSMVTHGPRAGCYEDPDHLLRRITPPPEQSSQISRRSPSDATRSNSVNAWRPR